MAAHICAAVAFPPRLNGGSETGHISLNSNVGFQVSDAPEDNLLQEFPLGEGVYVTDL